MKSCPVVSIIIPCHNAAPWLGRCLESCYSQTCEGLEVILVNDRSTDESAIVAKDWLSAGLIVLESDSGCAAAARNAGLRVASGKWVQFLDADDILGPDKIQLQLALAAAEPSTNLVSGEWARFKDRPENARFTAEPNWANMSGIEFLRLHLREGWMMQPGAWLTRRATIDQAGWWNESLTLNDDGEFFARVMLTAGSIQFCEGARVYYRSHATGSLSGDKSEEAMTSLYESYRLTFEHMLNVDSTPETREAVADGWRWLASELFEYAPDLSVEAEARALEYGGSRRPLPGGRLFKCLQPLFGWRTAKWMEKKVCKGLFRKPSQ